MAKIKFIEMEKINKEFIGLRPVPSYTGLKRVNVPAGTYFSYENDCRGVMLAHKRRVYNWFFC